MKTIVTTDRLILREFNADDHAFIIELLNSEGWLKFIGNRNITDEQKAKEYINNTLVEGCSKNGFGFYCVQLKEKNQPIGMCGFVKRETLPNTDFGFAFLPEYHNQGFAFEIALPTLQYGFDTLKFKTVDAIVMPTNERSTRLLTKLEFNHVDDIVLNNEPLMLFRITKQN